jgi:hypothetical protein
MLHKRQTRNEYSSEVTNFSMRPLVDLQPGLEKNDIDLRTWRRREDEGREQNQGSLLYLSRCSSSGETAQRRGRLLRRRALYLRREGKKVQINH